MLVDNQDLGVGDRLAHGRGTAVELLGRQVGRAKSLGESVHQEDPGRREALREERRGRLGHGPAGIGDIAQVRAAAVLASDELGCARRLQSVGTPASPVIRSGQQRLDDLAREHERHQHEGAALLERGHELVHAGVEAEGEHGQDALPAR